MADREREDQGVAEIQLLINRKPPITDTEILVTVENLAKELPERAGEASKWADSMWERAASQLPKDEKLLALWFETKFSAQNYKAAQRVCRSVLASEVLPDAKTVVSGCYGLL